MQGINFKSWKVKVALLVILGAIAWSSSITNEFVGYDDIKLIVRNDKVHNDLFYTIKFYFNIVSDSHNVAWTNFPTVIYRPLEWVGSAIGYHIWGPRAWAYHFFVNFSFHILNGLIFLLILSKVFGTRLHESKTELEEFQESKPDQSKSFYKTKKKQTKQELRTELFDESAHISWWVPLVIISIWIVHPLHNEAVNMLTSGVGFLWATLLCLSATCINLYVKDLTKAKSLILLILAWIFYFVGYHGSEMTVIGPIMLCLIFLPQIKKQDYKAYGYEIQKLFFAFTSLLTYLAHRSHIVSESKEWLANGVGEFIERVTVVAPQIFMHYIKLFFFPAKLTIDEHHNVVLQNSGSLYHIVCFLVALTFVIGIFYFLYLDEPEKRLHNKLIAACLFFTGFSISISLNIIPLYCLARDRYTYFFTLGLIATIILLLDKYLFSNNREEENRNSTIFDQKHRIWLLALILTIVPLSARSFVKSFDWRNGENFWTQTMDSTDDIGAKQNWRYRLLQYYKDPGTSTFVANQEIKAKALKDFNGFGLDNGLNKPETIQKILKEAKDPKKYLLNKYGYIGNKTIASGLFFNATTAITNRDRDNAINYFKLAHIYYPDHFQTNLQMLIHTYGENEEFTKYILDKLEKDAVHNSFLAKGLMDGLFFIKHPEVYEYAKIFKSKFPNTQVFQVYLFHGAYFKQKWDEAYIHAKKVLLKYHENPVFENYIKRYESERRAKMKV